MNAVEFLFAFFTVFGVSGFWFLWTKFVYDLENKKEDLKKNLDNHSNPSLEWEPASEWASKKWKSEVQILK